MSGSTPGGLPGGSSPSPGAGGMDATRRRRYQAYLDCAREVDAANLPRVGFYCRYYVVERLFDELRELKKTSPQGQGQPAPNASHEREACETFLRELLTVLEKTKEQHAQDEWPLGGQEHRSRDFQYCRNFALQVFAKADESDRATCSTGGGGSAGDHSCVGELIPAADAQVHRANAVKFFKAVKFFDVLEQFGLGLDGAVDAELVAAKAGAADPEARAALDRSVDVKREYAKFRAAHLNDCVKKGVRPIAPDPVDDREAEDASEDEECGGRPRGGADIKIDGDRDDVELELPTATVAAGTGGRVAAAPAPTAEDELEISLIPGVVLLGNGKTVTTTPGGKNLSAPTAVEVAEEPGPEMKEEHQVVPQTLATEPRGRVSTASSFERKAQCQKNIKTALQCLDYDDLENAKTLLQAAIRTLEE